MIMLEGRVIADTHEALTLREVNYLPVQYIPRKDVDTTLLVRTHLLLPLQGRRQLSASLWAASVPIDAVWSYEAPHQAVAVIKDHLAFYPDCVDAIEIR